MTMIPGSPDRLVRWRDPLLALWLVLPAVVWAVHGFRDDLGRDAALYVYAGQAVADGEAPYAAVMNRAGPVAHLLPGLGVALGRLAGADEVVAVRVLFFALAVLAPWLVYVATRIVFGSRLAGCVAAAAMVGYQVLARMATTGPDSKLPMVVLLALGLVLLMRRQMLLTGVVTGLATLTWQPVLFTLGAGALVMTLTDPRGGRARLAGLGRFVGGGLATLAVTVAAFAAVGALEAFLDGFLLANLHTEQTGLVTDTGLIWARLLEWLGWSLWPLLAGCALSVVLAVGAWRQPRDDEAGAWLRHRTLALATMTVGALAWSGVAFQAVRDALLLLPMASVALGGAVAAVVARLDRPVLRGTAVVVGAAWVMVVSGATVVHLTSTSSTDLVDERAAAEAVFTDLPADATVLAIGAPQPLALTGRDNLGRYVLLGDGMWGWIAADTPGGFDAYLTTVLDAEPTVIFTPFVVPQVLKPLGPEFDCVGARRRWKVWLDRDLDRDLRREVAADLAAVPSGATLEPRDGKPPPCS